MVPFNDFREWIEQAEKIGELKHLEGADPHLEMGTMVQVNGRNEGPVLTSVGMWWSWTMT